MDELDCHILKALQNDFPLSERPYEILAHKLQIPCDQLWNRIQRLIAEGVIRRIGASLDSRKLGFCSTLAAVSCKAELVEQAAKIIGQFPEVTHSYLRNDKFNIWFTILRLTRRGLNIFLSRSVALYRLKIHKSLIYRLSICLSSTLVSKLHSNLKNCGLTKLMKSV